MPNTVQLKLRVQLNRSDWRTMIAKQLNYRLVKDFTAMLPISMFIFFFTIL